MRKRKFEIGHHVVLPDSVFDDIFVILNYNESCIFEPQYFIRNISDSSRNDYEKYGLPERFLELYDEFDFISKKYCFEVVE